MILIIPGRATRGVVMITETPRSEQERSTEMCDEYTAEPTNEELAGEAKATEDQVEDEGAKMSFVPVDLENAEDQEPTQEEKAEAVREFAAWAITGDGSDIPFLDREAIDQGVAAAEASGNWDDAFANAAYAINEVNKFAADPLGAIMEAMAEAMEDEGMGDGARVLNI